MELQEVMATRRSIRSYTERDVSAETVEQVIRAAMQAPSAGNQQPWHFIIVRSREKLEAIPTFHPYAKMVAKAPVAIVVCGEPEGKKWPDFWVQDCSAAIQNMLLAARDLGLGSVWVGVYPLVDRMEGMRRLFSIPEKVIPLAVIPLGWPESDFKPADRYNESLVHQETW